MTPARLVAPTLLLACLLSLGGSLRAPGIERDGDDDGKATTGLAKSAPNDAVQAAFAARSYAAGTSAELLLRGTAETIRIRLFHAATGGDGPMQGKAVSAARTVAHPGSSVSVAVGHWPSGLYYARVDTPGRGSWVAPFVLRPQRLGEHRVAVVLPTNTWQAYNYEDGGSWYLNASVHTIDLRRPYIDGGVPPHFHGYDRGFLRWLVFNHKQPDFFSDDDLDAIGSGRDLARAYDLVVFSGHEEYVSGHEFDIVKSYRDLGGNLAFLSANNFFYKVVKHGDSMEGRWRWRDIGRPEAALIGSQYVDWNHDRYPNRPYTVRSTAAAPWLFRGTDLHNGSTFGVYGIEIDAVAKESPRGTKVIARIADAFGPGQSAEMTYYTTAAGAKVFASGVMNFGGSALWPTVRSMIGNVWSTLGAPDGHLGASAVNRPSPTR